MAHIITHPASDREALTPAADPLALRSASEDQPAYTPPTDEDWQRLDLYQALERLGGLYGYRRVATVARSLAEIFNASDVVIERPVDRCLADGVPLPVSRICVRCGRDNS